MADRVSGPLSGLAAGAVTLGVAELGAVVITRVGSSEGTSSPLLAVASGFIDRTPSWLKDFAVQTFGTADKIALFTGMAVVLAIVCAVIGAIGAPRRNGRAGHPVVGMLLFALVGIAGLLAVASRPGFTGIDLAPTVVGVLVGMGVLSGLWRAMRPAPAGNGLASRRSVLGYGGALLVVGALGIAAGRALSRAAEIVEVARSKVGVPAVAAPVSVPAGADQGIAGQPPYISENEGFYRIDTAPAVPIVDPDTWRLRVHGMVDREIELSFQDLLVEPMVQALVTLTCVSNTIGGSLIGNAVWTGWPVRELLARAGVQSGANMVLSTSADGWAAGTPLEALTDDRNALIAVGMNGEPLPVEHGFPVRLVVPGLYGYVSATKWVVDLKVTTFEADMGYWTDKGWSALGPIKTGSRIDVPSAEQVSAGEVVVAGVAWDQHTGIGKVEVQIDDDPWQQAELAEEPSIDSWRQWKLAWQAEAGDHRLRVRATDADGVTQTEQTAPPAPDGATGWHTINLTVQA